MGKHPATEKEKRCGNQEDYDGIHRLRQHRVGAPLTSHALEKYFALVWLELPVHRMHFAGQNGA